MSETQYGIKEWYIGDNARVDIVFVHGLRGDREETWQKDGCLWPKELLSKDVPNSRIMAFGYDSSIVHLDPDEVIQGSLDGAARSLCSSLQVHRSTPETDRRPLILVAHSLGGLVCAKALVLGERSAEGDAVQAVAKMTRGLIFLGTPFAGSELAKPSIKVQSLLSWFTKTDKTTLKILDIDSGDLKELGEAFPDIIRKRMSNREKIQIVFFYEELDTLGQSIVEQRSASGYPGTGEILPIRANHVNICKFSSRDDDGYKVVKSKIIQFMQDDDEESNNGVNGVVFNNHGNKINNQSARDIHQTFSGSGGISF